MGRLEAIMLLGDGIVGALVFAGLEIVAALELPDEPPIFESLAGESEHAALQALAASATQLNVTRDNDTRTNRHV